MKLTDEQRTLVEELAESYAWGVYGDEAPRGTTEQELQKLITLIEEIADETASRAVKSFRAGTPVTFLHGSKKRIGKIAGCTRLAEFTIALDEPYIDGMTSFGIPNRIYRVQAYGYELEALS